MAAGARTRWEWSLVAAGAVAALVLGVVGFGQLDPAASLSERIYRSVQLFTIESGAVEGRDAPLALEIARVLAPLVAASAAIRAILILLRTRLAVLRVRLFAHGHVVVAGLGAKGFTLVRKLHAAGERVVAVEQRPDNQFLAGCRERDVPVLVGDAADPAVLAHVRAERAATIYVTTGDDRRNIDVGFALDHLPVRSTGRRPTVLVHLDDVALWRRLAARLVGGPRPRPYRVAFFSARETAARLLLQRYPPFPAAGREPRRPRVLGWG